MIPITKEPLGVTNPAAGVIPTNPAINPFITPSKVGFPVRKISQVIQDKDANALEIKVFIIENPARPFAPNADPALNPNHPTIKKQEPTSDNNKL
mmetsp:Transcript_5407/g.5532  ORF Transcript_5407/g.5532 Transcript_5407/m.5532 type:complete len:95 (-) Transcript_5407:990-1274(-)